MHGIGGEVDDDETDSVEATDNERMDLDADNKFWNIGIGVRL